MGLCGSVDADDREARRQSELIEKRLKQEYKDAESVTKLLLLGAGECGKSTILKQMRIMHNKKFSKDEIEDYKLLIRQNTLQCVQQVCHAVEDYPDLKFKDSKTSAAAVTVMEASDETDPIFLLQDLKKVWKSKAARKAKLRGNEFNLLDSCDYFMEHIDRTFERKYEPTMNDIVRTRVATTGIIELDFEVGDTPFKMYDVGGQRGERKKWIHCFENVKAILFIAALSEYDQALREDPQKNRMEESLSLFEGIISLPWFQNTEIILFLNKADLFKEKAKVSDLGLYFADYTDGCNEEKMLQFIQEMYFDCNASKDKCIYAHVTTATDTGHMKFVWKATVAIVLNEALGKANLQ